MNPAPERPMATTAASEATLGEAIIASTGRSRRYVALAARYTTVTTTVPRTIPRETSRAGSRASPAAKVACCHPPYDHRTPIIAAARAVDDGGCASVHAASSGAGAPRAVAAS